MSGAILSEAQRDQIVRLAAEAGAKAALETLEKERQRESREMADRRLQSTKLLLKNYRDFKAHATYAVYEAEIEVDVTEVIMDFMMSSGKAEAKVESIKESMARTVAIVNHIDAMLDFYKTSCFCYGSPEDERRWEVIYSLYISDDAANVDALAVKFKVDTRTIYKDITRACERLSVLLFGIDGIKKR